MTFAKLDVALKNALIELTLLALMRLPIAPRLSQTPKLSQSRPI
jgi:hypothetical protein